MAERRPSLYQEKTVMEGWYVSREKLWHTPLVKNVSNVKNQIEDATTNRPRQTAAANRSDDERLQATDSSRAHPVLPHGRWVPDKTNLGRSHKQLPLPVMAWVDSSGRGELLP